MPRTSESPFVRLSNVVADMVEQETQLVVDLFDAFRGNLQGSSSLTSMLQSVLPKQLTHRTTCSCEIPPPCWMPCNAGEVTSFVCAGATATVQIAVTNCTMARRVVEFRATGKDAGKVTVAPPQLELGPLESGTVSASLAVPAGDTNARQDVILWVYGCKLHYIRWNITTTSRGGTCCHEVQIEDCQDYLHHWYDHFYCERPCLPQRANPNG
jgi:hypothetical protein